MKANAAASTRPTLDVEIAKVSALAEFGALLNEGGATLASDLDFRQITDANNSRGFTEAPVIAQIRAASNE